MPKRIFSDALEAAVEPNRVAFTALIGAANSSAARNSRLLDRRFVFQTVEMLWTTWGKSIYIYIHMIYIYINIILMGCLYLLWMGAKNIDLLCGKSKPSTTPLWDFVANPQRPDLQERAGRWELAQLAIEDSRAARVEYDSAAYRTVPPHSLAPDWLL